MDPLKLRLAAFLRLRRHRRISLPAHASLEQAPSIRLHFQIAVKSIPRLRLAPANSQVRINSWSVAGSYTLAVAARLLPSGWSSGFPGAATFVPSPFVTGLLTPPPPPLQNADSSTTGLRGDKCHLLAAWRRPGGRPCWTSTLSPDFLLVPPARNQADASFSDKNEPLGAFVRGGEDGRGERTSVCSPCHR